VIGQTHRLKKLAGFGAAAACLALTSIAPSYAQQAPALGGSWLAGPDGTGSNTIVGRVETPRAGQNINPGSSLLVTGWAADLTASGWSGIDGVEVWAGAKDKGGTKLATGSVGLSRTDVAEIIGSGFTKSGFTAVIPSSALSSLNSGSQPFDVYLHTPGKGTWYRSVSVNVLAPLSLPFPNDPVVWIAKPLDGQNITQKQNNSKFTFSGVALDRNPLSAVQNSLALLPPGVGQSLSQGCPGCVGATSNWYTQYRGAGVNTITAYLDNPPAKGDNSIFGNFGTPCGTACLAGVTILANNKGVLNQAGKPQGSVASRNYGSQFDFSGWVISMNPMLLTPGPHTLFVTATSAVTGKSSTASVTFNIIPFSSTQRIQP
jgi:hypothetical protein